MNIPPEAVDAVLALVRSRDLEDGIDRGFDDYADIARLIREELEAAAPFIAAQALRDAAKWAQGPEKVRLLTRAAELDPL